MRDDMTHYVGDGCDGGHEVPRHLPETSRWVSGKDGDCAYCGRSTVVRMEPFGSKDCCLDCFSQLVGT